MGRVLNGDGTEGPLLVAQFPSTLSLTITLQSDPRNEIFPPVLLVT